MIERTRRVARPILFLAVTAFVLAGCHFAAHRAGHHYHHGKHHKNR